MSYLIVGHLQQIQHYFMSSHVLQQPLLLLPNSSTEHLIQSLEDLQKSEGGGAVIYKNRVMEYQMHFPQ